ncbi:hypothetical protein [Formosa algae]|uniref:hypothetical protein n=1 Tax=Formosa algae TaxID=225843 RepID=UPI00209BC817|nr:hypothetical protein [Formosa algae]
MKYFIFAVTIFCFISCSETTSKNSKLIETFKASNTELPRISVHRGGKNLLHYPENCLETLQYVNDSTFCDIRD